MTPHVTKNDKSRSSNLDRRTTRQPRLCRQPESPLADRKELRVAQADRTTATGQAARTGESGLAVRLQLRRAQPAPSAQTDGPTDTGKIRGAVCLNDREVLGAAFSGPQTPVNTDQTHISNRSQTLKIARHKHIRHHAANFNKFLEEYFQIPAPPLVAPSLPSRLAPLDLQSPSAGAHQSLPAIRACAAENRSSGTTS